MVICSAESWAEAKALEGARLCAVSTQKIPKQVYALLRMSVSGDTPSLLIPLTGESDTIQGDLAWLNSQVFRGLANVDQVCDKVGLNSNSPYPHPRGFGFRCTSQGPASNLSIAILTEGDCHFDNELEVAASLMRAINAITAIAPLTTRES